MEDAFDATIAVVAADEPGASARGARGTAELEGSASRQLSQDEKAARATYVVSNDGRLEELEAALGAAAGADRGGRADEPGAADRRRRARDGAPVALIVGA